MADHDYVCGASGLTIGYQKVRVLLLVESNNPEGFGIDGQFYPLAPALRAKWNRDGNRPDEWVENISYQLAHAALKKGLTERRNHKMEDLLEQLPGGLTMRQIKRRNGHPDSPRTKLGKRRAAPWVPTTYRVLKALKDAGIQAYAEKISYGNVRVANKWEGRHDENWYAKAAEVIAAAGYHVHKIDELSYGYMLVVRPFTLPLTLDDVRAALSSGGWPEADLLRHVAEPEFETTTHTYNLSNDKPITLTVTAEKHREMWLGDIKGQGFRVEAQSHGFRVFHCVNGVNNLEAKSIESYYSRLRACGIACAPEGYKELEGRFGKVAVGAIVVPEQARSFESLVTQRRVRFIDNTADRYKRSLHHRRKRFVTWAVIREDVWQGLLKTQARKSDFKSDDGLFASRKATCVQAFDELVKEAEQEFKTREQSGDRYDDIWRSAEHLLDVKSRYCGEVVNMAVGQDPVFRVGLNWTFCRLAMLFASKKITREQADEAVNEFAELSHVRNVLADIEHQWHLPHSGYQNPAHDVMAKVRTDWAKLAQKDAQRGGRDK